MARKAKDKADNAQNAAQDASARKIAITYKSLADIHPYAKNPRRNDDAVEPVAKSIKRFGFKVPIIIDKDGEIVAGHTRYKAALKLGLAEVPTVSADDLTPAQVRAFRLADNKTGEMAGFDFDLLQSEQDELRDEGEDLTDFGFIDYGYSGEAGGADGIGSDVPQVGTAGLPPELQNRDLSPDELPKIVGDDETAMERVIIVYPKEREPEVAEMLGLKEIDRVVYNLQDLVSAKTADAE